MILLFSGRFGSPDPLICQPRPKSLMCNASLWRGTIRYVLWNQITQFRKTLQVLQRLECFQMLFRL